MDKLKKPTFKNKWQWHNYCFNLSFMYMTLSYFVYYFVKKKLFEVWGSRDKELQF